MHVSNLYSNAPMVRLAERLVRRGRSAASVFFSNSGAEANEAAHRSSCARRARAATSWSSTAPSTAAPTARCRPRRRSPSRRRSRRWCRASGAIAPTVRRCRAAVDSQTAGGADGAGAGRVRRAPDARRGAARGARGVRRGAAPRWCSTRSRPAWAAPARCGRYEQYGRRAGRDDARQGPRRRLADRRAGDRPAAGGRVRPRRPRLDLRGRPAGLRGRPTRRSTCSTTRRCSPRVRELGERLAEGLRELPRVADVRGRGLMAAVDVDADAPDLARRALLEQRLVINATGPRTLRFLPPLVVERGAGRRRVTARRRSPLKVSVHPVYRGIGVMRRWDDQSSDATHAGGARNRDSCRRVRSGPARPGSTRRARAGARGPGPAAGARARPAGSAGSARPPACSGACP